MLKNEIFDKIRKPEREKISEEIFKMNFDAKGSFDYEKCKSISHS